MKNISILAVLPTILAAASFASHQAPKITISGSVANTNGQPAPGAKITATTYDNGQSHRTSGRVGTQGAYEIEVPAGEIVRITFEGRNGKADIKNLAGRKDQDLHVRLAPLDATAMELDQMLNTFAFVSLRAEDLSRKDVTKIQSFIDAAERSPEDPVLQVIGETAKAAISTFELRAKLKGDPKFKMEVDKKSKDLWEEYDEIFDRPSFKYGRSMEIP
ncbi:MAG: carboxypeptidase-like regulatory domain-containing protein [Planctomycetota bacterium]